MREILKFFNAGDRLCSTLLTGWKRVVFIAVIFIIGIVCCGIYSTTVGAFSDWDLLNYQYYSPYALLNGRYDFDYAPAQIQTFLNPAPFVPFYLITTHFKPIMAGFIMGGIHGLVAGLLFLTAIAIFSSLGPMDRIILSLLCAALGVYGPSFLAFVGGSSADNFVSLFVLSGVYVLVRGIRFHGAPDVREARLALFIGGVLIGIAAGLKLVCAVFLIGYGIAVLVTSRGFRSRLAVTGLFGVAGVVGVSISRGYWMFYLWSRFGSPLFPFYNKIFKSPYYYNKNFADDRYLPKTFRDAMMLPFNLVADDPSTQILYKTRDIRYALVYGLLLLCLAALAAGLVMLLLRRPLSKYRLPDRSEMFLLVFFVVSYVIWQMKFAIPRYAVPLELLAPIVIAILIRLLLPWEGMHQIVMIAAFTSFFFFREPETVKHNDWSSAYIDVTAPRFDNPDETLVILASMRPWAYLIPDFQPEVRFVGLASTFSYPNARYPHRAADEMINLVRSHSGPIYILSSNHTLPEILDRLKPYNIVLLNDHERKEAPKRVKIRDDERTPDFTLPVITNHGYEKLFLWPAEINRK